MRRTLRLLVIAHVLATHGLAMLAVRLRLFRPYAWMLRLFRREIPDELGVQVREVLEALGPTFIKFGQMLSTRVDLLPVDVVTELKRLQDAVPPEPAARIRALLERTYRRPLTGEGGVFAEFDEAPVAAASIAQVHFARLHDGRAVAVKVRRPQIKRTIEADLSLLYFLAAMFDRYLPEYRRLKAPRVIDEFARSIREELNLRSEAAHASRFAENLAEVEGVTVPEVVWEYTTPEVLVTERIHGIPIDERDDLVAAGHDTMRLAERAASLFFHMTFVDGYFHADLHPGNIFVAPNGTIGLVDFGIVGRLTTQTRIYLAEMLLAFLRQDYARVAEVHLEAGYVADDIDLSAFEDALREIAVPIFNRSLEEISIAELLFYLFSVTERFQMETQPELLLLQKTMVVIEGVGRELEPQVNVWSLARPLVERWMRDNLGPKARAERAACELRDGVRDWLALPAEVRGTLRELATRPAARETDRPPTARLAGAALLLTTAGAWAGLLWPGVQRAPLEALPPALLLLLGLLLLPRR